MDKIDHIKRHKELHQSLDELVADMITHTTIRPSKASIFELLMWSWGQITNPTEEK